MTKQLLCGHRPVPGWSNDKEPQVSKVHFVLLFELQVPLFAPCLEQPLTWALFRLKSANRKVFPLFLALWPIICTCFSLSNDLPPLNAQELKKQPNALRKAEVPDCRNC